MLVLLLMIGAVASYDHSVNYWQAFAPGKLLQRLDALTLTDDGGGGGGIVSQTEAAPLPQEQQAPTAQSKLDLEGLDYADTETDTEAEAETDVDIDSDNETDVAKHVEDDVELELDSAEAQSGEDYERNYEQFVRQYFDRVQSDNYDHSTEDHDASSELDSSVETQAEASNLQVKKQQRCRRVKRKGQLCKICRESKNNEVSETCSYSHAAEPEKYAYGSGTQYKRYKDKEIDDDVAEQSAEQSQPAAQRRKQRSERHTTVPLSSASSSSLCVRRLEGKSMCYECKDSTGQRLRRCYDAALQRKQRKSSGVGGNKPRKSQQQSEQEQRIYKRTISYSYAQGSSQDKPKNEIFNASMPMSHSQNPRKLTKILRRRIVVPSS